MAAVCVYCASSLAAPVAYIELAAEFGRLLAAGGHTLISGGGSVSAMGAVARAVRAGGGRTVGVIPEALVSEEVADHDADELVVTPDMRSRKAEMDRRADAFVALPGGIGTLEELLEVWVARTLGLHTKPVVVVDPDGVYAGLRAQLDTMVSRGLARPAALEALTWVSSAAEALAAVEAGLAPGVQARAIAGSPAPAVEVVEAAPSQADQRGGSDTQLRV